MKEFTVIWNKVYCCRSIVKAETKEEAKCIALSARPDQETFGDDEDISVFEDK